MGIQISNFDDGSNRLIDDVTGNTVVYVDGTSRGVSSKFATVARTDTAAKNLFTLPPNAQVVDVSIYVGTASNAATTATVSVGKTGTNTFYVNAQDVKGASGKQRPSALTNAFVSVGASAIQVVGIYAETGTASTLGGPFTVQVDYFVA